MIIESGGTGGYWTLFAQVYWYENVRSISLKSEIDASIWRLKKMSFLWMTIKGIGGILI